MSIIFEWWTKIFPLPPLANGMRNPNVAPKLTTVPLSLICDKSPFSFKKHSFSFTSWGRGWLTTAFPAVDCGKPPDAGLQASLAVRLRGPVPSGGALGPAGRCTGCAVFEDHEGLAAANVAAGRQPWRSVVTPNTRG